MNQNKQILAGIILLAFWLFLCLFLGRNIEKNTEYNEFYQPQSFGHPLYQD